jgi:hypothetical protein
MADQKLTALRAAAPFTAPLASGDLFYMTQSTTSKGITADELRANLAWFPVVAFTAVPASTSTLTMTSDLTASIKVGYALKYKISSTYYYGVVTAIASNLLTIAGAPFSANVVELYYNTGSNMRVLEVTVPSTYEDASNTALMTSDAKCPIVWKMSTAYLVSYAVWSRLHDTGTHGQVSVRINDTEVNTTTGGLTVAADATWYQTVVDIAVAAYDINRTESLEVTAVKGGNGDAQDLAVIMTFVIP